MTGSRQVGAGDLVVRDYQSLTRVHQREYDYVNTHLFLLYVQACFLLLLLFFLHDSSTLLLGTGERAPT